MVGIVLRQLKMYGILNRSPAYHNALLISNLFAVIRGTGHSRCVGANWAYVLQESERIMSSSLRMAEAGLSIDMCGLTAVEWLEAFGRYFTEEAYECDEEGFGMRCLCDDCAKILRLTTKHKDVSMEFKTEIVDRVENLGGFAVYKEGLLDVNQLYRQVCVSTMPKDERLKTLEELIRTERKKGWNAPNSTLSELAIERYQLLLGLGRKEEAENVILEDVADTTVCKYRVDRYLEEGDCTGALALLSLGIDRTWKCLDGYHKCQLWEKKLEIYERLGDTDGMISSYRAVFSLSCPPRDLDCFHKLKALVPDNEWTSLYHDLMAEKRFHPNFMNSLGHEDTKAAILIEENLLDDLGEYLANVNPMYVLNGCEQYGAKVPDKQLEPLLQKCAAELRRMAEPSTGSYRYERIAHYMQVLQRLSGGKEIVVGLLEEFCQKYSGRPAMMRALRVVEQKVNDVAASIS